MFKAFPLLGLIGNTLLSVLAIGTDDLMKVSQQGGTLGGQALLFGAVIILGWVTYVLFKRVETSFSNALASQTTASASLFESYNQQRAEDRKHHDELIAIVRAEREASIETKRQNFVALLDISTKSAVALNENANAMRALGDKVAGATDANTVAVRELRHYLNSGMLPVKAPEPEGGA